MHSESPGLWGRKVLAQKGSSSLRLHSPCLSQRQATPGEPLQIMVSLILSSTIIPTQLLGSQRSWEFLSLHSPDLACGSAPGPTDCLCPEAKAGWAWRGCSPDNREDVISGGTGDPALSSGAVLHIYRTCDLFLPRQLSDEQGVAKVAANGERGGLEN